MGGPAEPQPHRKAQQPLGKSKATTLSCHTLPRSTAPQAEISHTLAPCPADGGAWPRGVLGSIQPAWDPSSRKPSLTALPSPTPCPLSFHHPESLSPTYLFLFTSRLYLIPGDLPNITGGSPGIGNGPLIFILASSSPQCRGTQAGHGRREVSSFPLGYSFQDLSRVWQEDAAVDDGKSHFPGTKPGAQGNLLLL